jgi:hypothetical protein
MSKNRLFQFPTQFIMDNWRSDSDIPQDSIRKGLKELRLNRESTPARVLRSNPMLDGEETSNQMTPLRPAPRSSDGLTPEHNDRERTSRGSLSGLRHAINQSQLARLIGGKTSNPAVNEGDDKTVPINRSTARSTSCLSLSEQEKKVDVALKQENEHTANVMTTTRLSRPEPEFTERTGRSKDNNEAMNLSEQPTMNRSRPKPDVAPDGKQSPLGSLRNLWRRGDTTDHAVETASGLQIGTEKLVLRSSENKLDQSNTDTAPKAPSPRDDDGAPSRSSAFHFWPIMRKSGSKNDLIHATIKKSGSNSDIAKDPLAASNGVRQAGSKVEMSNDQVDVPARHDSSSNAVPKLNFFGGLKKKMPAPSLPADIAAEQDHVPDLQTVLDSHVKPMDATQLAEELILKHSLLVLDFRNFSEFNAFRLKGSFNVNLPPLIVKRYRRGSIQTFNLHNFICEQSGKDAWVARTAEQPIVLIEDVLPKDENEWKQAHRQGALITIIGHALAKELKNETVFWLKGGFQELRKLVKKQSPWMGSGGRKNWTQEELDAITDTGHGQPVAIPAQRPQPPTEKSPRTPSISTSQPELNVTDTDTGHQNILFLSYTTKPILDRGRTRASEDAISSPKTPVSPRNDHSAILPYLILGADPALPKRSTSPTFGLMESKLVFPTGSQTSLERAATESVDLKATVDRFQSLHVSYVINLARECINLGTALMGPNAAVPEEQQLCGYHKLGIADNTEEDIETVIWKSLTLIGTQYKWARQRELSAGTQA